MSKSICRRAAWDSNQSNSLSSAASPPIRGAWQSREDLARRRAWNAKRTACCLVPQQSGSTNERVSRHRLLQSLPKIRESERYSCGLDSLAIMHPLSMLSGNTASNAVGGKRVLPHRDAKPHPSPRENLAEIRISGGICPHCAPKLQCVRPHRAKSHPFAYPTASSSTATRGW